MGVPAWCSWVGRGAAVDARFVLPICAHWEGREYPVRWPEQRPEPGPGDVVRLDIDGRRLWRSFRVVGRRDRLASDGGRAHPVAIDLGRGPRAGPRRPGGVRPGRGAARGALTTAALRASVARRPEVPEAPPVAVPRIPPAGSG